MDYEKSYEEIRDYMVSNSEPKYIFYGYEDIFGKIVWTFGDFKYTEFLHVIEGEDGETFTIDENGFFDSFSLEELKKLFVDFPNSGSKDFFDFFEKETGCPTHPIYWKEYSELGFGDLNSVMWSEKVNIDSYDDLEEMYESFQTIKNHDALQSELSVKGSKKKISKI